MTDAIWQYGYRKICLNFLMHKALQKPINWRIRIECVNKSCQFEIQILIIFIQVSNLLRIPHLIQSINETLILFIYINKTLCQRILWFITSYAVEMFQDSLNEHNRLETIWLNSKRKTIVLICIFYGANPSSIFYHSTYAIVTNNGLFMEKQ